MSRALPLLNLLQSSMLGGLLLLWPGENTPANVVLASGSFAFAAAAIGLWVSPARFATVASALCWASIVAGIVFCGLIASSSVYLLTIYGATGRALAMLSGVVMLNVAIVFAFIPGHEIAALRHRDSPQ
jgi:hypothetical protein